MFVPKRVNTAVTVTVQAAGTQTNVHTLVVHNAGATGNSVTLQDGNGTTFAVLSPPVIGTYIYDVVTDGLKVVNAGTTPPDVTITYA